MKVETRIFSNYSYSSKALPEWLPVGLILLLAGGLYLYQLGTESLWIDELISVDRAKAHNLQLLRTRPLYPLILNVWMKFGSSDAWLRGLNVLFSLGTVLLIYLLGRRLAGNRVGLLSALIFTLSPLAIHHAQEVRMYAISVFFGVLGSLIFSYALEKPDFSRIGLWSIVRWLAILATPLNLLLLLPDTVIFAWTFRSRPRFLYRFGIGLVFTCLLWLPWLVHVAVQSANFMGGVDVGGVAVGEIVDNQQSPTLFSVIYQIGRFTAWPFGRPNSNAIYGFYQAYSILMACVLTFIIFTRRLRSSRLVWLVAWAFLPLVPIFLVSHVSRVLWVDRYLLFTAPYFFILLAAGLVEIWSRQRIGAITITLIYLIAVSGGIKRYYTVQDREDWRGLVEAISENELPGDLIVWSMNQSIPRALNHYYQGSADIKVVQYSHNTEMYGEEEKLAAANWLSQLPEQKSRIWLVYSKASPTFLSVLEQEFSIVKHRNFDGSMDVFLLKPNSP